MAKELSDSGFIFHVYQLINTLEQKNYNKTLQGKINQMRMDLIDLKCAMKKRETDINQNFSFQTLINKINLTKNPGKKQLSFLEESVKREGKQLDQREKAYKNQESKLDQVIIDWVDIQKTLKNLKN